MCPHQSSWSDGIQDHFLHVKRKLVVVKLVPRPFDSSHPPPREKNNLLPTPANPRQARLFVDFSRQNADFSCVWQSPLTKGTHLFLPFSSRLKRWGQRSFARSSAWAHGGLQTQAVDHSLYPRFRAKRPASRHRLPQRGQLGLALRLIDQLFRLRRHGYGPRAQTLRCNVTARQAARQARPWPVLGPLH
jgi:hypothetical protein